MKVHLQNVEKEAGALSGTPNIASTKNKVDILRSVLRDWAHRPPGNDCRISAYAQALTSEITSESPLYEVLTELLHIKPHMGSSYLATKTLRAAQSQLYGEFPGYPQVFVTAGQWQEGFEWIMGHPDRYGQFAADLWTRPLQSNVSERYKGLKAFAVAARQLGRLGICTVLDIGCSQNAGLKHIASGVSFEPPTVVGAGSVAHKPNLQQTAALQRVLGADLLLDYSVGVDVTYPADARAWAWSCSHYPSELLDKQRVALFEALIEAQYDNVDFFKGDFSDFDHAQFSRQCEDDRFGIVHFSTVLYQASHEERVAMLREAEHYAQEFIVVQDFLSINPSDATELQFRDNWQDDPFPYRTVVRDMRSKSPRWREIFAWRDGRCRELAIGLGRLAMQPYGTASIWGSIYK